MLTLRYISGILLMVFKVLNGSWRTRTTLMVKDTDYRHIARGVRNPYSAWYVHLLVHTYVHTYHEVHKHACVLFARTLDANNVNLCYMHACMRVLCVSSLYV